MEHRYCILLNAYKINPTVPFLAGGTGGPCLSAIAQVDIIVTSFVHQLVLELAMESLFQLDLHDQIHCHDLLLGEFVTVAILPVEEGIGLGGIVFRRGLGQDHAGGAVECGDFGHRFLLHSHLLDRKRGEFIEIGLIGHPL